MILNLLEKGVLFTYHKRECPDSLDPSTSTSLVRAEHYPEASLFGGKCVEENRANAIRRRSIWLKCLTPWATASAQDFSLPARQADFKTFVHDFENSYAYLGRTEKPWLTWETRYAGAVLQADSKEALDAVLASAISELHDFHAEVRSHLVNRWLPVPTFADVWAQFEPSGAVVTSVRRGSDADRASIHVGDRIMSVGSVLLEKAIADRLTPAIPQGSPQAREWALLSVLTGKSDESRLLGLVTPAGRSYTVSLPVERHFDRAPEDLSLKRLPGDIGVIRFNNSLGEQTTNAAFDKALLEVKDTKV